MGDGSWTEGAAAADGGGASTAPAGSGVQGRIGVLDDGGVTDGAWGVGCGASAAGGKPTEHKGSVCQLSS